MLWLVLTVPQGQLSISCIEIEEALHSVLYLGSYTITLNMMEPFFSGIFGKGEAVGDVYAAKIGLK